VLVLTSGASLSNDILATTTPLTFAVLTRRRRYHAPQERPASGRRFDEVSLGEVMRRRSPAIPPFAAWPGTGRPKLPIDPAVPKQIEWMEPSGVPGRCGRADAFARGLLDTSR
jgi:hypothetical protein